MKVNEPFDAMAGCEFGASGSRKYILWAECFRLRYPVAQSFYQLSMVQGRLGFIQFDFLAGAVHAAVCPTACALAPSQKQASASPSLKRPTADAYRTIEGSVVWSGNYLLQAVSSQHGKSIPLCLPCEVTLALHADLQTTECGSAWGPKSRPNHTLLP